MKPATARAKPPRSMATAEQCWIVSLVEFFILSDFEDCYWISLPKPSLVFLNCGVSFDGRIGCYIFAVFLWRWPSGNTAIGT